MVNQVLLAARARDDFLAMVGLAALSFVLAYVKAFYFDKYGVSIFSDWTKHPVEAKLLVKENFSFFWLFISLLYVLISGVIFGFIMSYTVVSLIEDPEPHIFDDVKTGVTIRHIRIGLYIIIMIFIYLGTFFLPYWLFLLLIN